MRGRGTDELYPRGVPAYKANQASVFVPGVKVIEKRPFAPRSWRVQRDLSPQDKVATQQIKKISFIPGRDKRPPLTLWGPEMQPSSGVYTVFELDKSPLHLLIPQRPRIVQANERTEEDLDSEGTGEKAVRTPPSETATQQGIDARKV